MFTDEAIGMQEYTTNLRILKDQQILIWVRKKEHIPMTEDSFDCSETEHRSWSKGFINIRHVHDNVLLMVIYESFVMELEPLPLAS